MVVSVAKSGLLRSLDRAKYLGSKVLDSAPAGWTPSKSSQVSGDSTNYPIGPGNQTDGYIATGVRILIQDGLVLQDHGAAERHIWSQKRGCGMYGRCQRAVTFDSGFYGKHLPALIMDRPISKGKWVDKLKTDVTPAHADKLLYACCLCSGLVDSTLYNGNTIFVGLGASDQNSRPYGWARSLTSIGCFVLGCFLFARLNSALGPRQRGTLVLTFFLQTAMLIITAALVQSGAIPGIKGLTGDSAETEWSQEAPIVLLSIQSAGQIVASRALGYNEVPTLVITSLLCDLVSDPKLFFLRNAKRDRRMVAFILTLVGAIAGGWITKATGDIYVVMWLAAGIKFSISMAWIFWEEDEKV